MKSRFDLPVSARPGQAAGEFAAALLLLGAALYFALKSDGAVRRGDGTQAILFSVAALLLALVTAITIVPRLARRAKISRWLMPMSFSITRAGGVFILAIFLLSLAAINTGNNMLFLILAAMLSAIITSGIFARSTLRSVMVSMEVPENVFVGEQVSIKLALRNHKRCLPALSISVEDLGAGKSASSVGRRRWHPSRRTRAAPQEHDRDEPMLRHPAYFPLILPGQVRTELVSQSFPTRGRYRLEGFRLSTRFPFGFFRRGEQVRAEGAVLVYPSIHEVSSYFHLLPFLPGRLESRHVGQGESLFAIRKYQDGESARLVDWKATAKTGRLMAREYTREEESTFFLILDTLVHPAPGPDDPERFEKAVSLAASLAAHFADEGAELGLLTQRTHVPLGMGTEQLYRILRSLAVVQCHLAPPAAAPDLRAELGEILDAGAREQILSEKVFKIIITSKPRVGFPSSIWRSSHVVYFDEL